MVKKVIVLGGGSAGFMAALALRARLPGLRVLLIRSKDIGIIGVGEGSTPALTRFLHDYLKVGLKRFHDTAQPTWKLGLKFLRWGPRPHFYYDFSPGLTGTLPALRKPIGFYCEGELAYENPIAAMMTHDRAFERGPGGGPVFHNAIAYHFENEKYVTFLEGYARAQGVEVVEDTVAQVHQNDAGVTGLALASGRAETADLYVDCSGFRSELLGKALGVPFTSFASSLFCDRAVVGGWDRTDEVIKPYTTCEAMDSGWCWQIEHETRINRGYVYASAFIADDDAEREFRSRNPKVGATRVVRFVSGCYGRAWVGNVVGIGNATGFVEPLEATALGVIAQQGRLLADSLAETDGRVRPAQVREYNDHHARVWESIRGFIAAHYKFNTAADTPFWQHCRAHTDLGGAERIVRCYADHGPTPFWEPTAFDPLDLFKAAGYAAILMGQQVPYDRSFEPSAREAEFWAAQQRRYKEAALRAMTVAEALAVTRSAKWKWAGP